MTSTDTSTPRQSSTHANNVAETGAMSFTVARVSAGLISPAIIGHVLSERADPEENAGEPFLSIVSLSLHCTSMLRELTLGSIHIM